MKGMGWESFCLFGLCGKLKEKEGWVKRDEDGAALYLIGPYANLKGREGWGWKGKGMEEFLILVVHM